MSDIEIDTEQQYVTQTFTPDEQAAILAPSKSRTLGVMPSS
jgi:hypothetical protein